IRRKKMKKLLVIGGGFAGLWAALGAAHEVIENEAEVEITVVSKDPFLTVRPRLYESNPETLRVPLSPSFEPLGIKFEEGVVTSIDAEDQSITVKRTDDKSVTKKYDQLVLAVGSELRKLPVPGLDRHGFNIDAYQAAVALDRHLASILKTPEGPGHNTFVILGAGLTGIELATEMRDRIEAYTDSATADNARIILVEQAETVGSDLGANPRPAIEKALQRANVELRLGMRIEGVEQDAAVLSSGERVSTRTVIVTAGLQANTLAEMLPIELDELGRVPTDETLRVKGLPHVYVAGDVARAYVDDEHLALMSCQHAMTMGKFAGYNAARELIGLPQRAYRQPDYVTCIDLGRSGALFTTGWDSDVKMNGTDAKQLKRQINTQWIYPPEADRNALLAAAHIDAGPGQ
ncbi:MAG: FAD-dependent oxidoreductase, partial [Rhodospirillales bacterium]